MFGSIDQFAEVWRGESELTRRVLIGLDDAALPTRLGGESRSVGELAWHIVTAIREIGGRTGLPLTGPRREMPPPETVAALAAAYDRAATELDRAVRAAWSDADLLVTDDLYGEQWRRGATLFVLVCHQIHHRGQLTVLMRHADLSVPSVYGPSGDEWAPGRPRARGR
jgi:uncharacterized damage-inducible protein DinB